MLIKKQANREREVLVYFRMSVDKCIRNDILRKSLFDNEYSNNWFRQESSMDTLKLRMKVWWGRKVVSKHLLTNCSLIDENLQCRNLPDSTLTKQIQLTEMIMGHITIGFPVQFSEKPASLLWCCCKIMNEIKEAISDRPKLRTFCKMLLNANNMLNHISQIQNIGDTKEQKMPLFK